ncbi:uncharacterized protein LOC123292634 [Chrysoperla carnea]|uniref:uncharacterized protein LOC123292634 n=1 Tax=Chrysoperla carnea TaxID=189513 RepID=UPI001D06198D|nr:uncharacterized protein LOC123292634 [Chrysoperla carnea]
MKKVKNSQLNNAKIKSALYATSGPTPHVEVRAYRPINNDKERSDCDLRRKKYGLVHDFLPKTVTSDDETIDVRENLNYSRIKKNASKESFAKKDLSKERIIVNETEKKCYHHKQPTIPKICESEISYSHLSKFDGNRPKNERFCKQSKPDSKYTKRNLPSKYNEETYQIVAKNNNEPSSTTNSSGLSTNISEYPDDVLEIYRDLYLYRKKLLKEKTGETSTNKMSSNTGISSTTQNTQEFNSETTLTSSATNAHLVGLQQKVNAPDETKIAIQSEHAKIHEKPRETMKNKEHQYPLDKYINFTSKNVCNELELPPTCSELTQTEIDTENMLITVDETLESLQLDIETFINRTVAKFSNLSTTKYSDDEKLHVNRLINKWMTENGMNRENNRLDKTFLKSAVTSVSDVPNSHKHYNSLNTVTDIVVNAKSQGIKNMHTCDKIPTQKLIKESKKSKQINQQQTHHHHHHHHQRREELNDRSKLSQTSEMAQENLSKEPLKPTNNLKRLIKQDMPPINIRNALKIQHTGSINLSPNEIQRDQKSTNIGVFNIAHIDSTSAIPKEVPVVNNCLHNSEVEERTATDAISSITSDTELQGVIQTTFIIPDTAINYFGENQDNNIGTQLSSTLKPGDVTVENSKDSHKTTEEFQQISEANSATNNGSKNNLNEKTNVISMIQTDNTNEVKSALNNRTVTNYRLNEKSHTSTILSCNTAEETQQTNEAKSPENDGTIKNKNILGVFETNTKVLTEIVDLLNNIKQQKCCCLTNHNHETNRGVDQHSKNGHQLITKSIKMNQCKNSDASLKGSSTNNSEFHGIEQVTNINKDSDDSEPTNENVNSLLQSSNSDTSSTTVFNKANLDSQSKYLRKSPALPPLRKVSFTKTKKKKSHIESIQSPKSITQFVQTDNPITLTSDKIDDNSSQKVIDKLIKDVKQNVDKETNTGMPYNVAGCSNMSQTTLNSIDQGKNIVININPSSCSNNDLVRRTFTENIAKFKEFGVQTDITSNKNDNQLCSILPRKQPEIDIILDQIDNKQSKSFEIENVVRTSPVASYQKSLEQQALKNMSKVDEICQDMNASIQTLLAETSLKPSPFKNISIEYQDFANQFILDTVNSVRIPTAANNPTINTIIDQNSGVANKKQAFKNNAKSYRNKKVDNSNSSSLYTTTSLSEGEIIQPCNCNCSLGEIHKCTIANPLPSQKSIKKSKKSILSLEVGEFQKDNPHLRIQKTRQHYKNWQSIYTTSQSSSSVDESSYYSK